MGIDGLLRSLKEVIVNRHLSEYKGKVVAVDAYVWYSGTKLGSTKLSRAFVSMSILMGNSVIGSLRSVLLVLRQCSPWECPF